MTLEQSYAILKDFIQDNGVLFDVRKYLSWYVGDETATLDGSFTADELEAIAIYMRSHK